MGAPLDIGDVRRRSGLPASTLRYYEERGLVRSTGRRGLRRQYEPEVLEQLAFIALGQDAGLSLAEIRSMLDADGRPALDREALRAKAAAVEEQAGRLLAMRDQLLHLADCPAEDHLTCPSFRAELAAATSRRTGGPASRS